MAYLGLEWRKQRLYRVAVCSKTACQPELENVFGGCGNVVILRLA
jgi:hypothetical protein